MYAVLATRCGMHTISSTPTQNQHLVSTCSSILNYSSHWLIIH